MSKKVHMIGIGGIGMSALAQLYRHEGREVSGSDRTESPTTELLERQGITVLIGHTAEHVPNDAALVVYSDAVPPDNVERVRAATLNIPQMSYFEALGEVARGRRTIAIAGTHGKTTTTGMLGKILIDAGLSPTVIVGSIVKDFGSNYVAGTSDIFVVEACEYRDHFLSFAPEVLVVTNMEWDHTDYFPSFAAMEASFNEARRRARTVIDETVYKAESVPDLTLIGEFNRDNARAAKSAAKALFPNLSDTTVNYSLSSFQGTWRRFDYKGKTKNGAIVYDDYAHHPTAIRETILGAREKFPDKTITVAFHPHLYSRTRDLFDDFAAALATADEVILAPIYAAREVDDGTVSSDLLAEAIKKTNPHVVSLPDFETISSKLQAVHSGLIITMGAGDIYKVADAIVKS